MLECSQETASLDLDKVNQSSDAITTLAVDLSVCDFLPRELLRCGGAGTGREGRGGVFSTRGYFLYWTSIFFCISDINSGGGAGLLGGGSEVSGGGGGGGASDGGGDAGGGDDGGGGGLGSRMAASISGGGGGRGGVGGGGVRTVWLEVTQERMSCREVVMSLAASSRDPLPASTPGQSLSCRLRPSSSS